MNKGILLFFLICTIQIASAAHFIVGNVRNSYAGEFANDKEVVLWNPANGIDDNITDRIGVLGNSGADNIYMIDCEMLEVPCDIGNELRIKVLGYPAYEVNLSVTGAGYDLAPNITLNSAPNVTFILVEDSFESPPNQIDLIAASTRTVICRAIVEERDSDFLVNATAYFYHSSSSISAGDDFNVHYTNNSCFKNESYGTLNETEFLCNFEVYYYADPENWNCFFEVQDNQSVFGNGSDSTIVNTLLSVGVQNIINYSIVDSEKVSDETEVNITNYGNVMINISLAGYGEAIGDGLAMNCDDGNISVHYEKYNFTASNNSILSLVQADTIYSNLSANSVVRQFNLDYRKNDLENDAFNSTYWRIYVPAGISGECNGNIIFGAFFGGAS